MIEVVGAALCNRLVMEAVLLGVSLKTTVILLRRVAIHNNGLIAAPAIGELVVVSVRLVVLARMTVARVAGEPLAYLF